MASLALLSSKGLYCKFTLVGKIQTKTKKKGGLNSFLS